MESSGLNAATPSLDVKPSGAEGEGGIALKEEQFEPAVHTKVSGVLPSTDASAATLFRSEHLCVC